jgi:hypothetical protein
MVIKHVKKAIRKVQRGLNMTRFVVPSLVVATAVIATTGCETMNQNYDDGQNYNIFTGEPVYDYPGGNVSIVDGRPTGSSIVEGGTTFFNAMNGAAAALRGTSGLPAETRRKIASQGAYNGLVNGERRKLRRANNQETLRRMVHSAPKQEVNIHINQLQQHHDPEEIELINRGFFGYTYWNDSNHNNHVDIGELHGLGNKFYVDEATAFAVIKPEVRGNTVRAVIKTDKGHTLYDSGNYSVPYNQNFVKLDLPSNVFKPGIKRLTWSKNGDSWLQMRFEMLPRQKGVSMR